VVFSVVELPLYGVPGSSVLSRSMTRPAYCPPEWSHASGISMPYASRVMLSGSGSLRTPVSSASIAAPCSLASSQVEDVEVLGDAGGLGRLRDRGAALLQVPAQHHLSGRLAVLARDLTQRGVVEHALFAVPVGGYESPKLTERPSLASVLC
jgi:hypothetical protein